MPKISESQLVEMDEVLEGVMNDRMRLTRISTSAKSGGCEKKEYFSGYKRSSCIISICKIFK